MAKKIKFNLQVNGVGISSLESLQNNFNIEDILEHFKSGLLMRWLEVQGLETELKELNKLDQNSDNLAQSISKIFGITDYEYKLKNNELDTQTKVGKFKLDTEMDLLDKSIDVNTTIHKSKINVIDAVTKSSVKNAYESADKIIKLKQQSNTLEAIADISKNTGLVLKTTSDLIKLCF